MTTSLLCAPSRRGSQTKETVWTSQAGESLMSSLSCCSLSRKTELRSVVDRLHQHDVGVELPRLVNSSLTMVLGPSGQGSWQGAQAIRRRYASSQVRCGRAPLTRMLVSSRPDVCNTSLSVFVKWASQLCLRLSGRYTSGEIFQSSPIISSVLQSRHAAMHV